MKDSRFETCIRLVGQDLDESGRPNTVLLAEKLWDMALGGEMRATRLIALYTIGKPGERMQEAKDQRVLHVNLQVTIDRIYQGAADAATEKWYEDHNES